MTFTFTALLCLGLTLGLWIPVLTGSLPKPILRVQPDSVVSMGTKVTFTCEESIGAKESDLYRNGYLQRRVPKNNQKPTNKTEFSFSNVGHQNAGQYQCSYRTNTKSSDYSEALELVVTGAYWKPSLSVQCNHVVTSEGELQKPTIKAEPGSVIHNGRAMTIWCQGDLDAEIYFLHKEGSHNTQSTQTLQQPGNKAKFVIPSVTQGHAGQYRCYCYSSAGWSEPSDILELVVTGIYNYYPLMLSGLPRPVVPEGGNVTLHCTSLRNYDKFILTKEDQKFTSSVDTKYIYIFYWTTPSPVCYGTYDSKVHRTFRCYGYYKHTPQLWSETSELQKILISGLSKKPSLLSHQGHILKPGISLTLQCYSDINYDKFALYKVG